MKQTDEIHIHREDVEKFITAFKVLEDCLEPNMKTRIIAEYDPQKPTVVFKVFKETEDEDRRTH